MCLFVSFRLVCTYLKTSFSKGEGITKQFQSSPHFGSNCVLLTEEYIENHLWQTVGEIDAEINTYLKHGSGKELIRIEMIYIEVYKYERAIGRSYILTPEKLASKKATINPNNSKT